MRVSRRAAALGALGFTTLASLLATARAAGGAKRQCLTLLYPNEPEAKFDFAYYRDTHLALLRKGYGDAIGKIEVRRGLRKGDGSPAAYIVTVTIQINDMEAFDAAGKIHLPAVMADLANFSNVVPVGQIEELMESEPISVEG